MYFITMTCNPHWCEIVDNLGPGQTAQNRPNLVARVFNKKKTQLMHDLTDCNSITMTAYDFSIKSDLGYLE